ncbi:hypothetical protein [Longimycelium tulufanense]|uniref:hypothetical protein n=1 Tax=Longimycelium tulufanense TaxID=907463 RepID=UPI0016646B71|nr:hypothetical protein [Longimycelium tulufanense]
MSAKPDLIERWSTLPREELVDAVRHLVKQHDTEARRTWAEVREDAVLAARVRSALSTLRAEVNGSRDEAMWLMWIKQARRALEPTEASDGQAAESTAPAATAESGEPEETPEHRVTNRRADEAEPAPAVHQVMFRAPGQ